MENLTIILETPLFPDNTRRTKYIERIFSPNKISIAIINEKKEKKLFNPFISKEKSNLIL